MQIDTDKCAGGSRIPKKYKHNDEINSNLKCKKIDSKSSTKKMPLKIKTVNNEKLNENEIISSDNLSLSISSLVNCKRKLVAPQSSRIHIKKSESHDDIIRPKSNNIYSKSEKYISIKKSTESLSNLQIENSRRLKNLPSHIPISKIKPFRKPNLDSHLIKLCNSLDNSTNQLSKFVDCNRLQNNSNAHMQSHMNNDHLDDHKLFNVFGSDYKIKMSKLIIAQRRRQFGETLRQENNQRLIILKKMHKTDITETTDDY